MADQKKTFVAEDGREIVLKADHLCIQFGGLKDAQIRGLDHLAAPVAHNHTGGVFLFTASKKGGTDFYL